ncbi:UDP-glucose:undecaprenyl-phosphate glucose-1-phosphate transferase [Arthrobacter saudimassiliensis]|uniref:UDP-glucose:undecaprenyl-phosphate glucose-1-phosphate transferase n=1 Tax=Arthrobacter saudimassiliensis TaxID=1461584 RepID=A0A078MJH4_9MICC|nr:UDP-glucose:undecaprenyl-phosphate glucose-1-phosphate transferase [Arthrobacter saudimassiliensis]
MPPALALAPRAGSTASKPPETRASPQPPSTPSENPASPQVGRPAVDTRLPFLEHQPPARPSSLYSGKRRHGEPFALSWGRRYHHILLTSDTIIIISVMALAHLLRFGTEAASVTTASRIELPYPVVSVGIAVAWLAALATYRTRDMRVKVISADEYKQVISATVTLLGAVALTCVVLGIDIARGFFAVALAAGLIGLTTSRWLLRRWLTYQRRHGRYQSRVLVLGRSRDARYVVKQIQCKAGGAYQVLGVALISSSERPVLRVDGREYPVLADGDTVVEAARLLRADAVVVAGPVRGGSEYIQELGWRLEESATELILTTGLTNVAGPRIHFRPVEGLPLMHVELPQYSGGRHVLKRALDLVGSALALLLLLPVFVVLAVLVKRDSPGPVLFRQERVGRGGKKFHMLKFRSMVATAEDDLAGLLDRNEASGLLFKMQHDPRVTRVGRWMRRYSLDELPQFWNVLVGQMSLVGPRPPLQREVDRYQTRVHRRLYIKPGITGMWQTNGRSELNWKDGVRLDLYYVENWSLAGDLQILWRTVKVFFRPVGAY